jgi:hypothetical protein
MPKPATATKRGKQLEALIIKALNETRVAAISLDNVDAVTGSADQNVFMALMCARKARQELEQALSYLRRKTSTYDSAQVRARPKKVFHGSPNGA